MACIEQMMAEAASCCALPDDVIPLLCCRKRPPFRLTISGLLPVHQAAGSLERPVACRRAAQAADGSGRVTIGTCLLAGRMALAQCLHAFNASVGLRMSRWRSVQTVPGMRTVSWSTNTSRKCLPQRLHLSPISAHARQICAASVLAKGSGE